MPTFASLLAIAALLTAPSGLTFSHGDWELVCDNTGTCRAAGYQEDNHHDMPVSVLLTREAGPGKQVSAELMLGDYKADTVVNALPATFKLDMRIDGRKLGQIASTNSTLTASLTNAQRDALLAALKGSAEIEWVSGKNHWQLSGTGAAAVLLKMDEFQGRLGTRGALIRKGALGEDGVRKPSPPPLVLQAPVAKNLPKDKQLSAGQRKSLGLALRATLKEGDCEETQDVEQLAIYRLTPTRRLVSARCWSGAYQSSDAYWVIDDSPALHPVLVTNKASEYDGDGTISASFKGRGLGDCYRSDTWTWDGKAFVHTASATTGMCKLISSGGAWSMPSLVTDVRPAR